MNNTWKELKDTLLDLYRRYYEVVEEDLEESDISTHDNYIELYFCEKYKPFEE